MEIILACLQAAVEGGGDWSATLLDGAQEESRVAESAVKGTSAGPNGKLLAIKLAHTAVWAILVACILVLPVLAETGRFRLAAILSAVIWAECGVLLLNGWRCPMTDLAAKYTEDRSPDFDIYIPVWLARHNKIIFGTIFLVNEMFLLAIWWRK